MIECCIPCPSLKWRFPAFSTLAHRPRTAWNETRSFNLDRIIGRSIGQLSIGNECYFSKRQVEFQELDCQGIKFDWMPIGDAIFDWATAYESECALRYEMEWGIERVLNLNVSFLNWKRWFTKLFLYTQKMLLFLYICLKTLKTNFKFVISNPRGDYIYSYFDISNSNIWVYSFFFSDNIPNKKML